MKATENIRRPAVRRVLTVALLIMVVVGLFGGVAGASSDRATSGLMWMPPSGNTGAVPEAWASLNRTTNGVSFSIHTSELPGGDAYTVWWVVFNNPAACTTNPSGPVKCGAPDVGNAATRPSLQLAAGHLVGEDGVTTFGGYLQAGDTRRCDSLVPCNDGLEDPQTAEVHVVVRTHGPPAAGYVSEQIGSFNGACNAGEPNEGQCKNLQAAAFVA